MTNQLLPSPAPTNVPAPLFEPNPKAARRVLEFFTTQINNDHTRKAYWNATRRFAQWCEARGIRELAGVEPFHVAAFIKELQNKELQNKELQNKELQNKELQNKELQNKELQNKELQNKELQNKELQNKELQNKELQNKELQNKELQNKELQNKELQNKELQNKELQNKELQNKELQNKELQNKELQNKELQNKELQNKELQNKELQNKELQNKELQNKELQEKPFSAPTVKQHLAALRMLFDWLVISHVIEVNPAHAVRGPKYVVKKGKTPVLTAEEARELLDSIPLVGNTGRRRQRDRQPDSQQPALVGLRDRALIAVMVYSFARINAVLEMKVRDYFVQGRRGWVRLHEKGGKEHEVPCHHNLEHYLDEYIRAAGIAGDQDGPLFRTASGKTGALTRNAMWQQDAYRMIQRRAEVAGIKTRIGNHTFRATGITAYLKNKGTLEAAQHIANHESPRTTKLYDRRQDEISLDEVEKISI